MIPMKIRIWKSIGVCSGFCGGFIVVVIGGAVVVFMATAIEAWSRARLEDVRCIFKVSGLSV